LNIVVEGQICHLLLELEASLDLFFFNKLVGIRKFSQILGPLISEDIYLEMSQVLEQDLCSSPVDNSILCNVAIQLLGQSALINLNYYVEGSSEDIQASLLRCEVISQQEYQEYEIFNNSLRVIREGKFGHVLEFELHVIS
jgi:hypothetical protein